ncbi:MAG TPA: outer membrane beta-barrel protein [Cyclobacteriaceae bacterium]|jgi:hypothetical protein|nr:outer membrane beta-barrel protein [Cyclobacteriaceae bacterium]
MRKVLFSFLIFYSLSAQAQQSKFLLGINAAGVWNSYLLTPDSGPYLLGGKINWSAGIQSKYLLSDRFKLDVQVNFATKNFASGLDMNYLRTVDYEAYLNNKEIHYNVKQSYIEIPISVNYFFPAVKPVNFFCDVGLTNSFALSASYSDMNTYSLVHFGSYGIAEKYKDYLISLKAGAGALFPFGKSFYGSVECYSTIYLKKVSDHFHNPFQLALGFSVLKKLSSKKISTN